MSTIIAPSKIADKKHYCVVPICKGERFGLAHKFPMELERTMQWLNALDIPEIEETPLVKLRTSYFVCTRHFRKSDYKNSISRSLNKTAIPCINLKDLNELDQTREEATQKPQNNSTVSLPDPSNRKRGFYTVESCESMKKRDIEVPLQKISCTHDSSILTSYSNEVSSQPQCKMKNYTQMENENYLSTIISSHESNTEDLKVSSNVAENAEQDLPLESNDIEIVEEEYEDGYLLQESYKEGEEQDEEEDMASSNFVEIKHPAYPGTLSLDNFWLRDHCRCKDCYNSETSQRLFNILDLPFDVQPISIKVEDEKLQIKWSDNHESSFEFSFLFKSQVDSLVNKPKTSTLWDKEQIIKLGYAKVKLNDLIVKDELIKTVVSSLVKYGVAFIENVPANTEMTEMAIKRIFPIIQKTFWGEMWTFSDEQEKHSDLVYTKGFLGSHTDHTYFNDPSGLQILHCIKHTGTGGETFLVDGFKVLHELRNRFPDTFERLSKFNVPAEFAEEGRHHLHVGPLFKINDITGEPEQIRYNLYDRSVLNTIPQKDIREFYKDFRELVKLVEADYNRWVFKLNPGTVLIFDNWRVLHARHKYTGNRIVTGCYISRTDFLSKARVLGLID